MCKEGALLSLKAVKHVRRECAVPTADLDRLKCLVREELLLAGDNASTLKAIDGANVSEGGSDAVHACPGTTRSPRAHIILSGLRARLVKDDT